MKRRERLLNREASVTSEFEHDFHRYRATASRYVGGRLAEMLLDTGKAGSACRSRRRRRRYGRALSSSKVCPTMADSMMIPSPKPRQMLGISAVTLWRWRRDETAGFPRPMTINGRNYFAWITFGRGSHVSSKRGEPATGAIISNVVSVSRVPGRSRGKTIDGRRV
jgi:predicted DNA-binding transcriptional regulator AlpA